MARWGAYSVRLAGECRLVCATCLKQTSRSPADHEAQTERTTISCYVAAIGRKNDPPDETGRSGTIADLRVNPCVAEAGPNADRGGGAGCRGTGGSCNTRITNTCSNLDIS